MQSQFTINGMTCVGCQYKIKHLLKEISGVQQVEVNLETKLATIKSDHKIIESEVQNAIKDFSKYSIGAKVLSIDYLQKKTWAQTYKPVLLIFMYLILACTAVEINAKEFIQMRWMNNFMAGFFLVFSFFKLLNIKGFATSYAMYDIVAMRWNSWGFIYPFVEFGLGILLLLKIQPLSINIIVVIVMGISLMGVLNSVLKKQKIKCACLGDVFNLPMSTLTIIEDALMIAMSIYMIIDML